MATILYSFDYGRRAEYLTSVLLSPYAITVPIRGHDDRVESDFLCVGLEEEKRLQSDGSASPSLTSTEPPSLIPDLKLLFWVQTKSQSTEKPQPIVIESSTNAESILGNKMPYFIAMVNPQSSPPALRLYATSERVAFKLLYPDAKPGKIQFVPGLPNDGKMYRLEEAGKLATIYMGEPFLVLEGAESLDRKPQKWEMLKDRIRMDYWNFIYATAGLGYYQRRKPDPPGPEAKLFFPANGELTDLTRKSVSVALDMLNRTLIKKERLKDPDGEIVKAMDTLLAFLKIPEAQPSPEIPSDEEDEPSSLRHPNTSS